MTMNAPSPSRLSDDELIAEVTRLARSEREATTSLIAHLAELYGRRLHERAGFASLFTYCRGILRLSEHEAYDRMKAAKVARRYPGMLSLLASGRVNLTTVRLLAPHLTRTNHEEVFADACGKSKRQVQELLARRFPRPDVVSSVRKLPTVAPALTAASVAMSPNPPLVRDSVTAHCESQDVADRVHVPQAPRPVMTPLSPDRYQVTFTADAETCEMLEFARDPSATPCPPASRRRSSNGHFAS